MTSEPTDRIATSQSRSVEAIVIGSGPGGYVAAIRLGQLGKKAILIESDKLGGVCLNIGCIPSKALISASKLVKDSRNAGRMGINAQVSADLPKLQDWKQGVVNQLTSGVGILCKANKVEVTYGRARFVSKNEADVELRDDKAVRKQRISFESAIVATGTSPIDLPNLRIDGKRIISSTEALELREPPKKVLIVGGGVTGLEIGMAYANLFGTELVIVELLEQLLPGTDSELVGVVSRNLDRLGARVFLKSKVNEAIASRTGVEVTFEGPDRKEQKTSVDYVLVSIGRKPNTWELGLDSVGVALAEKGGFVKVDNQMRTNISNIFAIGDVTGPPLLAHKASHEGIVAAEVIAGLKSSADFVSMPAATFTDPEIAVVGLTPSEAEAKGLEFNVGKFPFLASGRALAAGHTEGFVKVLTDKDSGLVLGVGIVGDESTNLISEAALAIEMGATAEDIGLTVHPHPTLPESIMEAAENSLGKAIHIQNRRAETRK